MNPDLLSAKAIDVVENAKGSVDINKGTKKKDKPRNKIESQNTITANVKRKEITPEGKKDILVSKTMNNSIEQINIVDQSAVE